MFLPNDMQDSPEDEKPDDIIDEHTEFPDDVDVIDDAPGDEDSKDEFVDADVPNVVV